MDLERRYKKLFGENKKLREEIRTLKEQLQRIKEKETNPQNNRWEEDWF